ncbi:MAG TPA: metal-dependent transcriptional regulator [Candidatus Methanomethylophilaceae archaeon]|nr:metal-dependent transcriptional regulator [Candidatus Methanomethylophilaceae archaeon]
MISGNREDYLIEILRMTKGEGKVKTNDLANKLKVSPASVSEMIKVLSDEGFVKYAKYRGAELTSSGLEYARKLRRKHDLMERFLIDVLDMEQGAAHDEAHKMEHAISDDSAHRICRIIGAPTNNDCESCIDYDASKEGCRTNTRLSEMKQGESGIISHLRCEEPATVKKLISLGFVPGREVCIHSNISKCGPKVINIGNATFALDSKTASSVFVELGDD